MLHVKILYNDLDLPNRVQHLCNLFLILIQYAILLFAAISEVCHNSRHQLWNQQRLDVCYSLNVWPWHFNLFSLLSLYFWPWSYIWDNKLEGNRFVTSIPNRWNIILCVTIIMIHNCRPRNYITNPKNIAILLILCCLFPDLSCINLFCHGNRLEMAM